MLSKGLTLTLLFLAGTFSACAQPEATPTPTPTPRPIATLSPTPSPTATPTPTPPASRAGIFELPFQPPLHYDDPHIIGGNILRDWAEIEAVEGQYRWDIIDSRLQTWASHGKVATLRIITAGMGRANSPEWIFAKGVARMEPPGTKTVFPVFWDPLYLQLYLRFVEALGKRFDGDPRIAFVQVSVGVSGEVGLWVPEPMPPGGTGTTALGTEYRIVGDKARLKELWRPFGFTRERWVQTVNKIVEGYRRAFPTTPIAVMLSDYYEDEGEIGEEAAFAVSLGVYLQYAGLIANAEAPPAARPVLAVLDRYADKTPIVFEVWGDTQRASSDPKSPWRQGSLAGTVEAALRHKARFLSIYSTDIQRAQTDSAMRSALEEGARRFKALAEGG